MHSASHDGNRPAPGRGLRTACWIGVFLCISPRLLAQTARTLPLEALAPVPAWVQSAAGPPLAPDDKSLPIDLPYALRRVNASNPTIEIARQRVRQAYAVLGQARVLLIPNIFLGGNPRSAAFLPAFYHHDGFLQNANGVVFFTDKNQFILQGGLSMEVSLADAWFQPHIARNAWEASRARARAVSNDLQLDVAAAYLELLRVYAELSINDEVLRKTARLAEAADRAVKAGLGRTNADANQIHAELEVRRQERLDFKGQAGAASARLAQLLLLDPTVDLLPMDQTVVPIALVPTSGNIDELVATALLQRPELAENRADIAKALEQWRLAKYRPLIPMLQWFYYGASEIGGNPVPNTAGGRNDFIGQLVWEFKGFGLANLFQAREMRANYNAETRRLMALQATVAEEVTAAVNLVRSHELALKNAEIAVHQAEELWRKLETLRFGIGGPARRYDPLQPLLAVRAINEARRLYLAQVIEYNVAQFRLYWAMGQPPACALPQATSVPITVPVLPSPAGTAEAPPIIPTSTKH